MTQKRKAELQRKLSMAPVAKPPSDLADRIKADIPAYLDAARERARMSNSIAFTMRVAASIVLLVTSVFLAIQLLSRDDAAQFETVASKAATPQTALSPAADTAAYAARDAELTMAEAAVPPPAAVAPTARPAAQVAAAPAKLSGERNERKDEQIAVETVADAGFIAGSFSQPPAAPPPPPAAPLPPSENAVAEVRSSAEGAAVGSVVMQDAVASRAPAPVATAEEDSSVARRQRVVDLKSVAAAPPIPEPITVTASAPMIEAPKRQSAFGISTDPAAFTRVKNVLERGEKPAPAAIDVAAIINHFAGPPLQWPREVNLNVESSQAPLATDGSTMVRFTVDSSIGVQLRLTVELNERAIRSHRYLSGARLAQQIDESMTPRQSVSGVIELLPRERLSPTTRIATFTLQYMSPRGKPERITRVVQARDLQQSWASSTRRHRLATLGALWSESLRNTTNPSVAIADKANQLAGEEPADELAEDLAEAATASSRPRSSGPTGSGR